MKYFINNKIVDYGFELDSRYTFGTTYQDSLQGKYVALTEAQEAFYAEHPTASVKEVFEMQLIIPYQPTEEELLERAKQNKIFATEAYYNSDDINLISIQGADVYLDPDTRLKIKERIDNAKFNNLTSDTFTLGSIELEIPITMAEQMYYAVIDQYRKAYDVKQSHVKAISLLTTIEDINTYDEKNNYPSKLIL